MQSDHFELDRLAATGFVRRLEFFPEIGSTSDRALELAQSDDLETPFLVLADRQTAGRGRGVNRWWAASGALTFTLVVDLPADVPPHARPRTSLHVALAVRSAIVPFIPRSTCHLKWPNDLFVDGRKACGILLESSASKPGRLAIGVGVNVNNSFADAPEPWSTTATALCDRREGRLSMTDVLLGILEELSTELPRVGLEAADLADRWRPNCLLTGRLVRIDMAGAVSAGVCRGVDDDGALLLDTDAGLRRFQSGTIVKF